MTVLAKPSFIKRFDIIKTPLVNDVVYDEEKIEIHDAGVPQGRMFRMLRGLCVAFVVFLVVTSSIMSCVVLYHNYTHLQSRPPLRLQAFCAVPVDENDFQEQMKRKLEFRMMSQYGAEPFSELSSEFRAYTDDDNNNDDDDDFQVISNVEDQDKSDSIARFLREELDIGSNIEKIYVPGGSLRHFTSYVHDWAANTSGIVEGNRCFILQMNPDVVLPPPIFMMSIQQGGQFDVSRVRNSLTAELTPLEDLSSFGNYIGSECRDKPTYRLQNVVQEQLQKRSADSPAPHFMHFSGKHVHEIHVTNMEALLQSEKEQHARK